jgi:hypothetical protein
VKPKVKTALFNILTKSIYPANPRLMRNDSKAADQVWRISNQAIDAHNLRMKKREQDGLARDYGDEFEARVRYGQLNQLSRETVRKNIRELWAEEIFSDCFCFIDKL